MDKGNGIYVDGALDIIDRGATLRIQNNEGAGIYVRNAADAGQTNRLNLEMTNGYHHIAENIAGIVVGDPNDSTNAGNAEMYVTFDEDNEDGYGYLRAVGNSTNGIHIAKNAYMSIENADIEIVVNGKKNNPDASDCCGPSYTKIGDANGILVEGDLDIKGIPVSPTGENRTGIEMSYNSLSGMEIRNAADAGQTNRVTITDMDIDIGMNDKYGILVGSTPGSEQGSARLDIVSTTGYNWFGFPATYGNILTSNDNLYTDGNELIFAQNGATVNITNMNFTGMSENTAAIGVDNATLTMKGNGNFLASEGQVLSNNKGTLTVDGMHIGGFYVGSTRFPSGELVLNDSVSNVSLLGKNGIETLGGSTIIRGNGQVLAIRGDAHDDVSAIYVSSKDGQRGNFVLKDMKSQLAAADGAIRVIDSDMSVISTNRDNFLYVEGGLNGALRVEAVDAPASIKIDNTVVNAYAVNNGFADLKGTGGDGSNRHTADLSITDGRLNLFSSPKTAVMGSVLKMQDANVNLTNTQMAAIEDDWNGENFWSLANTNPTTALLNNPSLTLIENTSTSTFNATGSSLIGSVTDNGRLTATLTDSTWHMINESNPVSTIDTLKTTDSRIDFTPLVNGGAHSNHTLTIKNAFVSDNTDIFMNVNLDENNVGDKIIFADGASMSGSALLHITNTAPSGSHGTFITGDGIKVVDALGTAVTGAKAFDLAGKKLDAGAYVQELFYQDANGEGESWYLRTVTEDNGGGNQSTNGSFSGGSAPVKTDLANTTIGMPVAALSVIKTINSELRNRLGELRSNNPRATNGMWARGYYKSLEVDENIKNEMDISGIEAGYDHLIGRDARNRTYLGIMAGYAHIDNIKIDQTNGHKGKGDGSVPSVGAYLTWVNKNGWYTDAVVRGFLTQFDITNVTAQGMSIHHDADRMAVSGSFEFGRRSSVYQRGRNGLILEPKAQIAYTFMPSKDQKTSLGQKINYGATNSLVTRGALMAAYRRVMANGIVLEPYVQAGIAYEWLGETDVAFDGVKFTSDVGGATFEGSIGLNARLSRGWHMFADAMMERGSVYKSWGGHLGFRYNF